jgi:hypothetical protein
MLHHDLDTSTNVGEVPATQRPIFRASTMQQYRLHREKDVLPRFLAPPVFLFQWIILGLALLTGLLLCTIRVPVSIIAPGVLLPGSPDAMEALLFVPAEQAPLIRAGLPVSLQLGTAGPSLQLVVTSTTPRVLSPARIRSTYGLDNALGLMVRQPAVVARVVLPADTALQAYAGSLVDASIQTGTQSIFSLFTQGRLQAHSSTDGSREYADHASDRKDPGLCLVNLLHRTMRTRPQTTSGGGHAVCDAGGFLS